MTAQPGESAGPAAEGSGAAQPRIHHEHVRTEGETEVDDAIGTSDEPS